MEQEEEKKDEIIEEVVDETIETKEEEPVKEEVIIEEKKEESPVDALLKKQAELEAKLAELEERNRELELKKAELDAQARIEQAKAEGWLLPGMLVEDEDGKPSVFVDLAKEKPELFDRLKLVMAPKSLPKPLVTESPVDGNSSEQMSDDEIEARVSAIAKDKGISYADALKIFRNY